MFLIGFALANFIKQPILSFGTVFLFIYGLRFSSKGINAEKHDYYINLYRLIFCFIIPFLNFFMYWSTIGGNAGFGFTFSPLTILQKLSFLSQIILIFLPEICKFLSRKNLIQIDEKKQKLASAFYPIALILTICMAYN
ncbi:hypothetical protein OIO07_04205 [Bacillus paralicheniformis]|uniref:hypothetical protein n=1 Tax=Bacillus TaxID=1386 RepID=UPI000342466A|nr:hypothetical protein [Bacillus paralicheniformis]KJD53866.1 hypothetical protein UZ38_30365 [Bacillus amyloliquefaciens]KUL07666.1 membrane protein [Bacillus licheniformis LMG 7559]MBC8624679.1 hypothetical protein [Robertmurraya crescens]AGN36429.1 hypothetical protein BaLi_c20670 [Bacillus paralicheniformis ATCC 9945a]AYQ16439.1 hypothetical protein D5285_10290 [Bacillus paralicheniformis]